jgi:15-cis-phytoene desaturase
VELLDGRRFLAPACVTALPPDALGRVLPQHWREQVEALRHLEKFRPTPYLSVYLWFDRKLTDLAFWSRHYRPEDLNLDFYDLSNICSGWGSRPSVIASNIIGPDRARGLTDEEVVARTIGELAEFLPAAANARLLSSLVNHVPMAIHAPLVGSEALRPSTTMPLPGLVLAGDWLQTGLPPSMESACMSGWRAAERVLDLHGRPRRLVVPHQDLDWCAAALGAAVRAVRSLRTKA